MFEKLKKLETSTPLVIVYPSGNKVQAIFCEREGDKYYFFDGTIFSFSEAFIKKGAVSFIFDKNDLEKVTMLSAELKSLSAI